MEALAKGAVRFSRRFTLKEIRDRWRSLLYDPCESKKASFGMSEVDNLNVGHASKLWKITGIKESGEKSAKRKTESIRRKFYAMRKRIRDLDFTNNGLYDYHLSADRLTNDLLGDHTITNPRLLGPRHETFGILEPVGGRDKLQADTVSVKLLSNSNILHSDAGDLCPEYGKQEQHRINSSISDDLVGLSSPTDRDPLWKLTEDVPAPLLPMSISPRDKTHDTENRSNLAEDDHGKLVTLCRFLLFIENHYVANNK